MRNLALTLFFLCFLFGSQLTSQQVFAQKMNAQTDDKVVFSLNTLERLNAAGVSADCKDFSSCQSSLVDLFQRLNDKPWWSRPIPFLGNKTPQEHCSQITLNDQRFEDGSELNLYFKQNSSVGAWQNGATVAEPVCLSQLDKAEQKQYVALENMVGHRLDLSVQKHNLAVDTIDRILNGQTDSTDCGKTAYSLDEMAERGRLAFQIMKEKTQEISGIVESKYGNNIQAALKDRKVIELEAQKAALGEMYPWMEGGKVKSAYYELSRIKDDAQLNKRLKELIQQDLENTKAQLQKNIKSQQSALSCMKLKTKSCPDALKAIQEAPELELPSDVAGSNVEKEKWLLAKNYLNQAQCAVGILNARTSTGESLAVGGVEAVLSLTPLAVPKLLVNASRLTMMFVNLGVAAADTAWAAREVSNAVAQCKPEILVKSMSELTSEKCEKNGDYYNARLDHEECALRVLAGAGSALLPFVALTRSVAKIPPAWRASSNPPALWPGNAVRYRSVIDEHMQMRHMTGPQSWKNIVREVNEINNKKLIRLQNEFDTAQTTLANRKKELLRQKAELNAKRQRLTDQAIREQEKRIASLEEDIVRREGIITQKKIEMEDLRNLDMSSVDPVKAEADIQSLLMEGANRKELPIQNLNKNAQQYIYARQKTGQSSNLTSVLVGPFDQNEIKRELSKARLKYIKEESNAASSSYLAEVRLRNPSPGGQFRFRTIICNKDCKSKTNFDGEEVEIAPGEATSYFPTCGPNVIRIEKDKVSLAKCN